MDGRDLATVWANVSLLSPSTISGQASWSTVQCAVLSSTISATTVRFIAPAVAGGGQALLFVFAAGRAVSTAASGTLVYIDAAQPVILYRYPAQGFAGGQPLTVELSVDRFSPPGPGTADPVSYYRLTAAGSECMGRVVSVVPDATLPSAVLLVLHLLRYPSTASLDNFSISLGCNQGEGDQQAAVTTTAPLTSAPTVASTTSVGSNLSTTWTSIRTTAPSSTPGPTSSAAPTSTTVAASVVAAVCKKVNFSMAFIDPRAPSVAYYEPVSSSTDGGISIRALVHNMPLGLVPSRGTVRLSGPGNAFFLLPLDSITYLQTGNKNGGSGNGTAATANLSDAMVKFRVPPAPGGQPAAGLVLTLSWAAESIGSGGPPAPSPVELPAAFSYVAPPVPSIGSLQPPQVCIRHSLVPPRSSFHTSTPRSLHRLPLAPQVVEETCVGRVAAVLPP